MDNAGFKLDIIKSISQIPSTVHPDDLDGFVQDIADAVRQYWALEKVVNDHLIATGNAIAVEKGISVGLRELTHVAYLSREEAQKFADAGFEVPSYQ